MRKLLIMALAVLSLTACMQRNVAPKVPEDAVRELCEYMVRVYPQATLQDLYKTCYQDFFGAEHMISDTVAARAYLRYELNEFTGEGVPELRMPMHEPTGFRHRFVRLNLQQVIDGQMTEDELFNAFLDAANTGSPAHTDWEDEWCQIESIALQVHPQWQNAELQALLRQAAQNKQAVHHSAAFRETYHPHYRIVKYSCPRGSEYKQQVRYKVIPFIW